MAVPQARVGPAGRGRARRSQLRVPGAWTRPFGMLRPVDEIAMLTRRYMHEYGATRDHLANVAMAVRKHANMNPAAIMYDKPMTPRRLHGVALGVASRCACSTTASRPTARWRASSSRPSGPGTCATRRRYVHAFAQGLPPEHQTMVNFFNDDPLTGRRGRAPGGCGPTPTSGPRTSTWRRSTTPSRPLILLSLEGYGFCKRGEAGGR